MEQEVFELQGRLEPHHWWFRARREILVGLGSSLLPETGRVLDVGCGTGGNISAFPAHFVRVGVDPSSTAISIARKKSPDVDFVCGSAPEDVLEELVSADLVLLNDVLEHVEEDQALLGNLLAFMKPGATILITVPANPALWSPHDVSHGHFRRYTWETIAHLWEALPAELILLAPLNRRLYPLVRAARVLTQRFGWKAGPAGTDLALPPRPLNWLLYRLFAGEKGRLERALLRGSRTPRSPGVSLLALLRCSGNPPEAMG